MAQETQPEHPGEILFIDKIAGTERTERADAVPETIAWYEDQERRVPVVRIVSLGTPDRREIQRFGPDDEFLDTTIQAPPPSF